MKHSFAATNPCHVYDMALAMWHQDALEWYHSGYPRWRLDPPAGFPLRVYPFRTLVTYAMQRFPEALRVDDERMFRWQDRGFDKVVAAKLEGSGFIHGLPGQSLEIFRAALKGGMIPVLNHASGPIEQQRAMIAPEYARHGIDLEASAPLPKDYLERLEEEKSLAAVHCVASTVVREQLCADGVDAKNVWVVPYGADPHLFPKRQTEPQGPFRICFAGRQSLRKGIHYLLQALQAVDSAGWELHCFGMEYRETRKDFENYTGRAKVIQRGSLPQKDLAEAFHKMDLLVLPSAEEAFGLVVVQALECGIPCVVSDRVGAKDLIREGGNGSVTPFGDVPSLAEKLLEWAGRRITVTEHFPWVSCADRLIRHSSRFLKHS